LSKYNIDPQSSYLIGDRITDIQSGSAAGIKLRCLLVNQRMLEINENSDGWPQQVCFIPINNLNEIASVVEAIDEN
jgi:histidinol phosphatase-like enzyme